MEKFEQLEQLVSAGQIKIHPQMSNTAWIEVADRRVTFITFAMGIKEEGERIDTWVSTEARAWKLFWAEVLAFIGDRRGTLYWRMLPRIEQDGSRYSVMARLGFDEEKGGE